MRNDTMGIILTGDEKIAPLTDIRANSALPIAGRYRIIDFVLSNCSNSGIDTVGVLTQYKPQRLNSHIGIGSPWDLDRVHGGIATLPPYMTEQGGDWYKGTANAVYQNLNFMEQYEPNYVLLLSGDHIYKMNYRSMLKEHIKKGSLKNEI